MLTRSKISLRSLLGLLHRPGHFQVVVPDWRAGERALTSVAFTWEPGRWTHLKLQLRKTQDGWEALGKVWMQNAAEPDAWRISHVEKEEPSAGRPGIWGSPFSGTPIRYDDLKVTRATGES